MEGFSIRELQCFLALAEEKSFTQAAKRLGMSQPPLSRHIQSLEEKIGTPLFVRSRREIELTQAGKAFREESRDILPQMARAGESARRAASGENERLDVGFVSALLSPELVEIFARFRRNQPQVQLNLHDRLPSEQVDGLIDGELDLGFVGVAPPRMPQGLSLLKWMEEPLHAYLPPGHRLAGEKEIELRNLSEEPFVMISSEAAPGYAAFLRRVCEDVGFRPRIVQEARRAQAVAAMTVAGTGVSILPSSLHRITRNSVRLCASRKPLTVTLHVLFHKSVSRGVRNFLEDLAPGSF